MANAKKVDHFSVTHPLGMHARVCSRWIKAVQTMTPKDIVHGEEWIWIEYGGRRIPANSLFKLLETRIPCGAEFDLLIDENCEYNPKISSDLSYIISKQAFELHMG